MMLLGSDMIKFVRKGRAVLRDLAVFTATAGSLPNLLTL